ncbi:MAG: 4-hydroxy-3-methylbut-2-enyl diphosphate reductase [Bacteroidales bacterium]|nr:4-hydroxy-3-methylbut-2-enyl diphosphate reductase [Bacteroidales bacterium]
MMKIEIDKNSGFCFGVVKAIETAESELQENKTLYCLGDIVHNDAEVKRLEDKGLITISREEFKKLKDVKVLLRAHGEPPETYKIAQKNNIELIDASCPIVLNLQKKIDKAYKDFKSIEGQIIIFGKEGHAEVIGLLGHTDNRGIVISEEKDLDKIDFSKPINIFSQTTKSRSSYHKIIEKIKDRMVEETGNNEINFIINDSTCRAVSNRDVFLKDFAKKHDTIIFVSGKKSSNGKVLYEVCKKQNMRSYFVSETDELKKEWFKPEDSVGICGATSTPEWLMKKVKNKIETF